MVVVDRHHWTHSIYPTNSSGHDQCEEFDEVRRIQKDFSRSACDQLHSGSSIFDLVHRWLCVVNRQPFIFAAAFKYISRARVCGTRRSGIQSNMLAGSCSRTCVLVRARFGDVPVLLRNKRFKTWRKPKDGKGGKNLLCPIACWMARVHPRDLSRWAGCASCHSGRGVFVAW